MPSSPRPEEKDEAEIRAASALESAAMRYAEATTEIRRLTRKLAACDEDGPDLMCSTPVVNPTTQTSESCRKWHREPDDYSEGGTGEGYWESARPRAEWCSGCVAVQEIVDQRRAAKRRRSAALSAIGNRARAMIRRAIERPGGAGGETDGE
jgi:hypothetical protein